MSLISLDRVGPPLDGGSDGGSGLVGVGVVGGTVDIAEGALLVVTMNATEATYPGRYL